MIESKTGIQNKVRNIHNAGKDNLIDLIYLCNNSKTLSRLELNLKGRLKSYVEAWCEELERRRMDRYGSSVLMPVCLEGGGRWWAGVRQQGDCGVCGVD